MGLLLSIKSFNVALNAVQSPSFNTFSFRDMLIVVGETTLGACSLLEPPSLGACSLLEPPSLGAYSLLEPPSLRGCSLLEPPSLSAFSLLEPPSLALSWLALLSVVSLSTIPILLSRSSHDSVSSG